MKALVWMGFLALLTVANASAADRERVITITTDAFQGSFAIDVVRDASGFLSEMIYQTPTTPKGVLTLPQLLQGSQVIFSQQGHDVIVLSAERDFTPQRGGHLIVRFLNNGMDGSYKDFRVLIDIQKAVILRSDPDSSDPESDNNPYTGVFDRLFMAKNTTFGIVVGIDHVVPSYN